MNFDEMIEKAISNSDDPDEVVGLQVEPSDDEVLRIDFGETEKLASALEWIGRRGVGNLLEKEAMRGEATHDTGGGSIGTNAGASYANTTKAQVMPHKGAPPMEPPGDGLIPNNLNQRPGGGREVDTAGTEQGTHHPALSSNESARAYTKVEKAKRVSPALKRILDHAPYADPKIREFLSGKYPDKNIHAGKGQPHGKPKTKMANHDPDALRAEIQRRLQRKGA